MKYVLISLLSLILIAPVLAQTGSITGTITAEQPRNSVVYLESATKQFPLSDKHFSMDQKDMLFQPHILAVPVGAAVDFLNSDTPMHNVMWPSVGGDKKQAKNLGSFAGGQKRSFKFAKSGVIPVLCSVHPEMSAYIVVSPTPYFTMVDNKFGNYTIENVPDGDYTITAWHEGVKSQSKPVKVASNVKVDFNLGQ